MSLNQPPKILITGSSGMLGRDLTSFLKKSYQVVGLSRSGLEGEPCDLSDLGALQNILKRHPVDLIIHTAAYSDVDACELDPQKAYLSNALATKNVMLCCSESNIPWIHISTDYVFDGKNNKSYSEKDATGAVSIYGLSKELAEWYALASKSLCVVVRVSWLFGRFNPKNFVNVMWEKIKNNQDLTVLADQESSPTYTKDLCLALQEITKQLLSNSGVKKIKQNKIYHFCNTGVTTRLKMTAEMAKILRSKVKVDLLLPEQMKNRPAVRPKYPVLNNRLIQKDFGIKIRTWQKSLEEHLGE